MNRAPGASRTADPAQTRTRPGQVQRLVQADELRELLVGSDELAVVDVREYEVIRTGHLYHAAYLPASEIDGRQERVAANVPRLDTTVVLVGDEPEVNREAERWQQWGYGRVAILAGGVDAWVAAGGRLFSHVCVPSKALAETARDLLGTPIVQVEELAGALASPEPPLVIDVRTQQEYEKASIPGAVGLPEGELVAALAGPLGIGRRVVITCAFRTRGLLGAQSLHETGLVSAAFLEGGTSAWAASGRPLRPGDRFRALPEPHARADAEELAANLPKAVSVSRISSNGVRRLLADTARTTYVVDPRLDAAELPGAALPGSAVRHIPGGQLIEAVDEYLPVLRARVVLVDDPPHLHALATARWLTAYRQLQVYLLDDSGGVDDPEPTYATAPTPVVHRQSAESATTLDSVAWSRALPALAYLEPAGGFAL